MGKDWDRGVPGVAFWKPLLRVMKPGAHLLAFGGTRTYHRLTCAIEDAGFEIRDCLMWVYGCLSDNTEILVDGQWELYHKAIAGRLALCYNVEYGTFEWSPIQNLFVYDYKDTAYRIHSDDTDQLVSRNHRIIIEQNGKEIFVTAEEAARQQQICVPILENVPGVLSSFPLPYQRTGNPKSLLPTEPQDTSEEKACDCQELQRDYLCCMPEEEMETCVLAKGCRESDMFQDMQRETESHRVDQALPQGQTGMDRSVNEIISREDDWLQQSGVEGRSDLLQEEGQLCQHQVCEMSNGMDTDGTQGWICDGAQIDSGSSDRQTATENRDSAPHRPQSPQQRSEQPTSVCIEQGSQTIRASRYTSTTMARIEPREYDGIVWCVQVPTGAFVARRNGKVFITGNSGFPKSLDVSKAIDKISKRLNMFEPFANHFKEQREKIGLTHKDIAKHFPSKTGGLTGCVWNWENAANVPTKEQWNTLQPLLSLSDDYLDLIERVEAEREVVGNQRQGKLAVAPGQGNDRSQIKLDITTSATDAAKQWEGWGTALKPAYEPIILARKPLEGTVAQNVLTHGVGGLNIDGCRVGPGNQVSGGGNNFDAWRDGEDREDRPEAHGISTDGHNKGRWPANFIHDGSDEVVELFPESNSMRNPRPPSGEGGGIWGKSLGKPVRGDIGDSGSAARFFYCAKASKKERGEGNTHPTVKPQALLEYLVMLITPPEGIVLDPFAGSGSTLIAARSMGFKAIGIELSPEYCEIARSRLERKESSPEQCKWEL